MQDALINVENFSSLDWDLSLKLVAGNSNLAKDLMQAMLISLPEEQKAINNYFNNKQLPQLREQIHRLHGGCCYTGFSKLKNITKYLEKEIINQNLININYYIKILNQEIEFLTNTFLRGDINF
jgi:two-component system, NarL family, sensor histidine kinase BarA